MNRTNRRKHAKLRFTKPLRYVRGKWMVGKDDVTYAIRLGIPLHYYLRVIEMGLGVSDLAELGSLISKPEVTEVNNGD